MNISIIFSSIQIKIHTPGAREQHIAVHGQRLDAVVVGRGEVRAGLGQAGLGGIGDVEHLDTGREND